MALDISQRKVIENLNRYLSWHNLPLKMNHSGICNGLAIIYTKYTLEGRRKEFLELLSCVAGKKVSIDDKEEESVNNFVAEVLFSYKPEEYIPELNQTRAYETQKINNKPLKSVFDIPMATDSNNWVKIFADLKLQNDEVMLVRSLNHTISITKNNGKYEIYDPNYTNGSKIFSNETDLVKELRKNVFCSTLKMGLLVSVITHPEKPVRADLPKIDSIYQEYLASDNQGISIHDKSISTIEMAGFLDNAELVKQLVVLKKPTDNIFQAAYTAAANNNSSTLEVLLPELQTKQLEAIFFAILAAGRKGTFDVFIKNKSGKYIFDELITEKTEVIFNFAAKGGNVDLLQEIINKFKAAHDTNGRAFTDEDVTQALLAKSKDNTDGIMAAIVGKDPACLRLILGKVDTESNPLDDRKKLYYLLLAIKKNSPLIVQVLVEKIPPALLKTVSLSLSVIEKTDLGLLKTLESHGMIFSEKAEAIVAQKKHQPVGILLSIGVALIKFTDFCKQILFKNEGISCDENKFQFFTQQKKEKHVHVSNETENINEPDLATNGRNDAKLK